MPLETFAINEMIEAGHHLLGRILSVNSVLSRSEVSRTLVVPDPPQQARGGPGANITNVAFAIPAWNGPNVAVTVFYTTNQPVTTPMKAWVFDITNGNSTKIITLVPLTVLPAPSSFAIGPPPGGWRTDKTYQVVIQIDNATGGTPLIFDSKYPFSFVIDVNGNWIVTTPTTGGTLGG